MPAWPIEKSTQHHIEMLAADMTLSHPPPTHTHARAWKWTFLDFYCFIYVFIFWGGDDLTVSVLVYCSLLGDYIMASSPMHNAWQLCKQHSPVPFRPGSSSAPVAPAAPCWDWSPRLVSWGSPGQHLEHARSPPISPGQSESGQIREWRPQRRTMKGTRAFPPTSLGQWTYEHVCPGWHTEHARSPPMSMGSIGLKFESWKWKITFKRHFHISFVVFWKKSESWNPAVAGKANP